ncbi:MAG: GAF domain-containing protein [Oculatellaceae cyanobacterium Prado106]|jgi:signal transduction histidine kinase|nr:GAF domain-containing protein [Oculatellaceae cyanobacterium Prado106]
MASVPQLTNLVSTAPTALTDKLSQKLFERDRLIQDIANRIRQSLDLETILQVAVDEVRQFLQTDRVIILRFHPDGSGTIDVESVGAEWMSIRSTVVEVPCIGAQYLEAFRAGSVTAKADIYHADLTPCHLEFLVNFQVRANLVVPILQGDRLWGLLIAHHCSKPRHWQLQEEVNLLKQLTLQIGIAVQQAELYDQLKTELQEHQSAEKTIREQAAMLDLYDAAIAIHVNQKKQLETQQQSNQRLEKLGTLAGAIAHDLNNVLTPMLAVTQLLSLKFPNADPGQQQLFQVLEDTTRRGANLVQQVLSYARGIEDDHTVFALEPLLNEIQQVAELTFPSPIYANLDLSSNLWPVKGNATQLHQVLMNLAVNARDAMPQGGILSLTAQNLERTGTPGRPDRFVQIIIADTGMGIALGIRDRIFEPFFTTKPLGEGTGLGLSTVMAIVKAHQGWVEVNSEVGKGTQVTVSIPAFPSTDAAPEN